MDDSRRDESELKTSERAREKEKEVIETMKIWEREDKKMIMEKERERRKHPLLEIENDSDADDGRDHDQKRQKREREVVFYCQRDKEQNRDDNDQGTSKKEDLDKWRRKEYLKLKERVKSYKKWVLQEDSDDEAAPIVKKTEIALDSKIHFPSFRKNFYIEEMEISKMTNEEVATYRRQLGVMLYVTDVPKPIKTWTQTGLPSNIIDVIKKLGYERPRSIQAQVLPIIMSGQDCIGVARTGSGKTLAFVLPMLRHIKDQPPVLMGDGPVSLILAPTREVAQQIHSVITQFTNAMGITCMCICGGTGAELSQQISNLKWGCEIVVSTPGRMLDILGTSSGISNLRRVTYLVMDDVDQMICLGIEPQIAQLVQKTRPDRQTVLFSTNFRQRVQILARNVLTQPMGVQVG